MSVIYQENFKLLQLVQEDIDDKYEGREGSRKCHIFKFSNVKTSLPTDYFPLMPWKSISEAWLYGPATSLDSRKIVYPCSHFKCAVPCPCLLCSRVHPRCRVPASEACVCLDCIKHTEDHDNFHSVWHFGCKYCKSEETEDHADSEPIKTLIFKHHVKNELNNENLKCDFCDQTFTRQDNMMRHKITHVEDKSSKIVCKECGKQFTRPDILERHIKTIHEPHMYKCDLCEQTFNRKSSLIRHVENHTDKNGVVNQCSKCDKIFCTFKQLDSHFSANHEDLSCEHCGQSFKSKSSLNHHVKTRVASDCESCGITFCNIRSVNNHKRNDHA
jgi:hypothetical protein